MSNATVDASEDKSLEQAQQEKLTLPLPEAQHVQQPSFPDGGYGWVVVIAIFVQNAMTWGVNTTFGVYLSFYRATNFFPGASDVQFAVVGGLSVSVSLAMAPLSNYLTLRYNFKVPMVLGLMLYTTGQILAAFSYKIWQLILTQGILVGAGAGLIYCSSVSLPSQWFLKRRALALGITASGSGAGALVLSITTRIAIEKISLRWAFITNALVSLGLLTPVILLLRDRTKVTNSKYHPFQFKLLLHKGFLWVWLYGATNVLGYVLALYTLATYSTAGLGLSQAQGSVLQACLAGGQMVGRPLCGLVLDRFGRINMTALLAWAAGLSCLLVWTFGRTYAVLIVFAVFQGLVGGTIWGASPTIAAEVVGLSDLGSALSVFWVTVAIPALLSEPIGVWLIDYSQTNLRRTGPEAYIISIGFAGGCFCASALILLGAKRHVQGDWRLLTKS